MIRDLNPTAILERGLIRLELPHDAGTRRLLLEFGELVLCANKTTNLTGAKDLKALVIEHILDSLAPLSWISLSDPVVDLGSGAGLPGIPAAIAFPRRSFILLEPRRKRFEFLQGVLLQLGLANVRAEQKSAGAASQTILQQSAGSVLMRAVASPAKSIQKALPLVSPGGMLLLYEGRAAQPSEDTIEIARRLNAHIEVRTVIVPFLEAERHLWVVRKTRVDSSRRAPRRLRPHRRRST